MAWLLDTNVISELRKPRAEPRVVEFVSSAPLRDLYISSVTLAEIRYGIALSPDIQKRTSLQEWLSFQIRPMFDPERTLSVTEEVLLRWRMLMEDGRRIGHTFSQPDLLIAAIAINHGLTVVNRDVGQFEKARVRVFNPWAS